MFNCCLFDKNKNILITLLEGQIINRIEYSENIPLEDNCIKISFNNESYLLIYALFRLIYKGQIILSSADYYFDKNFQEVTCNQDIEDSLIYEALIKANKLLKCKTIEKVELNSYGDLILKVGTDIRIEVYFDTPEIDKDYYVYYGIDKSYFHLYKSKNQLTAVERKYD